MERDSYETKKNALKEKYPRVLSKTWLRNARIFLLVILLLAVKVLEGGLVD